jgi:outer membrane protein assembly factor BamE (lipoprotein component of BamABCDE complex)
MPAAGRTIDRIQVDLAGEAPGPGQESAMNRSLLTLIALLCVAALIGCQATTMSKQHARRLDFVNSHPELPQELKQAILDGKVASGMTREIVVASWGNPTRIEEIRTEDDGDRESWYYGNYFLEGTVVKLDFEGERLTSFSVNDRNRGSSTVDLRTAQQTAPTRPARTEKNTSPR